MRVAEKFSQDERAPNSPVCVIYYMLSSGGFAAACLQATAQVTIADVVSRKDYAVSPMPPGLINMLNPDELLDLIAYLFSGGNPKEKVFAGLTR